MWQKISALLIATLLFLNASSLVQAQQGQVLGVHILHPYEITKAEDLLTVEATKDQWKYVTIPFTLEDLNRKDEWTAFFQVAKEKKVIPIVRLATRVEKGAWIKPNRKNIVDQLTFLKSLSWPTDQKYVIMFNEVNHAKEWENSINPEEYAEILLFAGNWAHSENTGFVVLPAAMDLAAPNGSQTMEAFNYLNRMLAAKPDVFSVIDVWNSHSYPNPAFSAAPTMRTKNSLRGFEHELSYLKEKTGKDFQVMITETGWVANRATTRWLTSYYTYALQHIWSDPRIIAVTPFVLQGDPGPFSGFTFIDQHGKPTVHYTALQRALEQVHSSS